MSVSIPRRRRRSSKPPDLRHIIVYKQVNNLRNRAVSIIGENGTGRRTLLERFLNMDTGPMNESANLEGSTRSFLVDLETRPNIRRREIVHLLVFTFNLEQLTFENMYHTISQLAACAVIFDVTVDPTLYTAIHCMIKLKWLLRCPPRFILVGHKIDKPGRQVMPARGQIVSFMCGAERYYECSALMNIDVNPVLDALLIMSLEEHLPLP